MRKRMVGDVSFVGVVTTRLAQQLPRALEAGAHPISCEFEWAAGCEFESAAHV